MEAQNRNAQRTSAGVWRLQRPPVIRLICASAAAGFLTAGACTSATEPSAPKPTREATTVESVTAATFTSVVGTLVLPVPTVLVKDEQGEPLPGVTVVFAGTTGSGEIGNPVAVTGAAGTASPGYWALGRHSGVQTLVARVAGLDELVFTATAEAGPPAFLRRTGTYPAWALAGARLETPLTVRVTDSFDNPVRGAVVNFTVAAGDGRIEAAEVETDAAGSATAGVWTLGPAAGSQQVVARSGNFQVLFQVTACAEPPEFFGCIAPGSSSIAFIREGQLYVSSIDGSGAVQLTAGGLAMAPAWLPDGSKIAFVRSSAIHIISGDGSVVSVGGGEGYKNAPAWSPDGRMIVFTSWSASGGSASGASVIQVVSAEPGTTSPVILGKGWHTAWSPDGSQIAFVDVANDGTTVHTMNPDGSGRRVLTPPPLNGWYSSPAWSPDARRIAVTLVENCDWDDDCDTHIVVMDANGSNAQKIATGLRATGRSVFDPTWSPDGMTVAFTRWVCAFSCTIQVSAVNADGTGERTMILNASQLSWRR